MGRDRGASAVEYAILVAATAAILVIAVVALKDTLLQGPMTQFCSGGTVINPGAPAGQEVKDVQCD